MLIVATNSAFCTLASDAMASAVAAVRRLPRTPHRPGAALLSDGVAMSSTIGARGGVSGCTADTTLAKRHASATLHRSGQPRPRKGGGALRRGGGVSASAGAIAWSA